MKSEFKVKEDIWQETKTNVKHIKSRKLWGYVASNETPPQICIKISGPDDRGIQKDVIIDVKSLLESLNATGVIAF